MHAVDALQQGMAKYMGDEGGIIETVLFSRMLDHSFDLHSPG